MRDFLGAFFTMTGLIIIGIGIAQCSSDSKADEKTEPVAHPMVCEQVVASINGSVRRCENQEAVCYQTLPGGLSCTFKDKQ